MFGGSGNWARTFQSEDIKEGRSDIASRSSNCKYYLQARSFDRALVRAPLASHRLGLDLFLWSTKSCCPLRARTSLCSAPKVRRQDPAGKSYPPR